MKAYKSIAILLGGAALLATTNLEAQAPMKVGFVYLDPVGDAGWTYQHELGRNQLDAALKGKVATQKVDSVPEGGDAERVIRELAQSGCKVVFTTSFGYMNPTLKVAKAYPKTVFLNCTGYKTAANVGIYNDRYYEGRYLCGILAGKMTRKNLVGYVAAFPVPEVLQDINAFTRGMRSVNPKAEVRVVWLNSWFDPGKEREGALSLIAQGVDLVTHHSDSTAVVKAAEEKGVYSIACDSDMSKYGPRTMLTASVRVWGDYYIQTVRQVMDGKWKAVNTFEGIKGGMIKLAPFNAAVPKDVAALVNKVQGDIVSGRLHPFTGPVVDQVGKTRVPAGKTMTDLELEKMDYFVQGVAAELPKN